MCPFAICIFDYFKTSIPHIICGHETEQHNNIDTNYMGVSGNTVPLNPMVLLIIIPMKNGYFIGNINPTFSGPNPYGELNNKDAMWIMVLEHFLCDRIDISMGDLQDPTDGGT